MCPLKLNNNTDFNVKKRRPEETFKTVFDYYNEETLRDYALSKNMMRIQEKITKRTIELLNLDKKNALILDAGSGPGFTSMYLNEMGFKTVALDLIPDFLKFYDIKKLNPIVGDMCSLPFRAETFDAIISISALQWIYRDLKNARVHLKLIDLVKSFYFILKTKSKVVIQLYPKTSEILKKIGEHFTKYSNFTGNIVIDNPHNPKKKKIYIFLKK
jgi:18S rRNA (guanine1575-N7)-methyltransferase